MRAIENDASRAARPAPFLCLSFAAALLAGAAPALAQGGGVLYTFDGRRAGEGLGSTVANAGDINRDGYADVIVGAYPNGTRVYSGKDGRVLMSWSTQGADVAGAGDVNKDGWPDLIASGGGGNVDVYSGKDGSRLWQFLSRWHLSSSVSSAGDVDGDGHADLLIGRPYGGDDRAYVYSGKTGKLLYGVRGTDGVSSFGTSVCSADVNGDKVPDLIVGNPGAGRPKNPGLVWVFSGKTRKLLYKVSGKSQRDWFGWKVAVAGDVNKDGTPDLIVGVPFGLPVQTCGYRGYALVLSGKDGRTLHALRGKCVGGASRANFGYSVSGVGDVDGDTYPDLLVGAAGPYAETAPVWLFSGRSGKALCYFTGTRGGSFGCSVGGGGDVNKDGRPDFIVGEFGANGNRGRVTVFSGMGPAATSTFGKGCPSRRPLTLGYSGAPRLSKTLNVNLTNGPASAVPGVVLLGFNDRAPYPIDLAFLGMPGCFLWHASDLDFAVQLVSGKASLPIAIPNDDALCGHAFFNEGAALDRGANALGVSASNAGKATIGW